MNSLMLNIGQLSIKSACEWFLHLQGHKLDVLLQAELVESREEVESACSHFDASDVLQVRL